MSEEDTWRNACWRLHRLPRRRGHRDDGTENRADVVMGQAGWAEKRVRSGNNSKT